MDLVEFWCAVKITLFIRILVSNLICAAQFPDVNMTWMMLNVACCLCVVQLIEPRFWSKIEIID